MKTLDLSGHQFGHLVAVSYVGKSKWLCICSCGKNHIAHRCNLKNGKTRSCGCRMTEGKNVIHGKSKSRLYRVWSNMKLRCFASHNQDYHLYGARGITVCDRWKNSFANFLADMGEPSAGLELDRIDNNGNYEPGNCRWVTRSQNCCNRRSTRLITFNGETLSATAWEQRTGIGRKTLVRRLDQGWDVDRILTTPMKCHR